MKVDSGKHKRRLREVTVGIIACLAATAGWCQDYTLEGDDTDFFTHQFWKEPMGPEACHDYEYPPDTALFTHTLFYGDLPKRGYPFHQCLLVGLNDTLTAWVTLYNVTGKNYVLKDKNVQDWFEPQVFQMYVKSPGAPPFAHSTQLGYRRRGWVLEGNPVSVIDTLRPEDGGLLSMTIDIWGLPQGHYQICLQLTNKVPTEFNVHPWGYVYEYYPPRDLADSCNGYESCYWRMVDDKNFLAAREWVDSILAINPTSVLGWWLNADNALAFQDTTTAKKGYDKAIEYLNTGADPAMPDSTKRPLMTIEKMYIQWLQKWIPINRAKLGP